jgi:F-type H+-transporting ATPase subunit a
MNLCIIWHKAIWVIRAKPFVPFLVTLFLFVLLGNLIGLLPYAFTYTSHISVTLTLALISIGVVIGTGFTEHGLGFFKPVFAVGRPPFIAPVIVPIEVVSFLAKPCQPSYQVVCQHAGWSHHD